MTCFHDLDLDPVVHSLLVTDDIPALISTLDTCTRSAVEMDALFHVVDAALHHHLDEYGFYFEVLTALESPAEPPKLPLPAREPVATEPLHRVPDVAHRIGMSGDWTRRHFEQVAGVKIVKSPRRRGKREYSILLIPQSVLERELRNMNA
jgi:hypothetical protein